MTIRRRDIRPDSPEIHLDDVAVYEKKRKTLERAREHGWYYKPTPVVKGVKNDPEFSGIIADPSYQGIVEEEGLFEGGIIADPSYQGIVEEEEIPEEESVFEGLEEPEEEKGPSFMFSCTRDKPCPIGGVDGFGWEIGDHFHECKRSHAPGEDDFLCEFRVVKKVGGKNES